jgi:hypothetical protein
VQTDYTLEAHEVKRAIDLYVRSQVGHLTQDHSLVITLQVTETGRTKEPIVTAYAIVTAKETGP